MRELLDVIRKQKRRKARGPDDISNEFFKEMERDDLDKLQKEILEKLKPLFND